MSRFNQHFTSERNNKSQKEYKESSKKKKVSDEDRMTEEMRREMATDKKLRKILIGR